MMESSLAQSSYQSSAQSINSERGLEYQVFAHVTRELSSLRKETSDYHAKKAAALTKNMRLWTFLAEEVSNENNPLPKELRANIFYLAEFTRQHTSKVYAGDAEVKVLIEVNTSIMRGLRNQTANQGTP